MYHLKLCKGRSYRGIVSATKAKPDVYVPEKEQADALVASGYFTLIEETVTVSENEAQTETVSDASEDLFEAEETEAETPILVELQGKKKAELVEYAEKNGINISGCNTKDDILQRIVEAIANADAAREALRQG
ncbi:MAG: hypothetical protein LUF92_02240 [Clostridiales bacterium]|nr:hypothetical protein [Clostridiales bacterium]